MGTTGNLTEELNQIKERIEETILCDFVPAFDRNILEHLFEKTVRTC
jgi:hypothetical protein